MKTILSLLTLVFSSCLFAQVTQDESSEAPVVVNPPDPVALFEEITVVGEKNFFTIRHQITRAEDDLYRLFNDLNSKDEFDITCREFKINSHISQRSCEPLFLTRKRRANTIMSLGAMRSGAGEGFDPIAMQFEALNEEIFRIASENPQYLEALMRVGKLKAILAEERTKKFGKD
jgi:hypothetical protein